jgi:NAD(P)-dependent dehydrogenase (short-subunit alcohol dehydrogenase family)
MQNTNSAMGTPDAVLQTSLKRRIALVVGGTSGIGRATAILFAQHGATVILSGRNQDAGQEVVREITGAGGSANFIRADVTDTGSIDSLIQELVANHGRLDIAFNNAGREAPYLRIADLEESDWQSMLDLKLTGVWRCMKFEIAQMLRQKQGIIVNMAGNWGLKGAPGYSSYCAAAHGIMGLTRTAAMEYGKANIRVNAVCPGAVDTALLDRMVGGSEDLKQTLAQAVPMGRLATPEDVAQTVMWLCSDGASYITGQGIALAGGD